MTAAAAPYLIPLISTIGGTLLQSMAASGAAKKQSAILAAADQREKKISQANRSLALTNADKYNPETRAANQQAVENTINTSLNQALGDGVNPADNTNQGNVSSDYNSAKMKASASDRASGIDTAKLLAKMRAPNQLRTNENIGNADVASQIGEGINNINNYSNAARIGISGVQPDLLLTLLGKTAQTYGTSSLSEALKALKVPKVPPVPPVPPVPDPLPPHVAV